MATHERSAVSIPQNFHRAFGFVVLGNGARVISLIGGSWIGLVCAKRGNHQRWIIVVPARRSFLNTLAIQIPEDLNVERIAAIVVENLLRPSSIFGGVVPPTP